jgi:hypothetical protein
MKITRLILTIAAGLLLVAAVNARGQTITNTAPNIPGLTSTLGNWLSSYNTNFTFQDIVIWDGPIYQDGVNVANELGGSVDLWKSKPIKNGGSLYVAVEARFRQASVGGLNLSEGGGIQLGWTKYDFKIGLFGEVVYLNHPDEVGLPPDRHLTGEFGIQAMKMLSPSVATGIFISQQIYQPAQIIGVNLNVSFGNGTGVFGLF